MPQSPTKSGENDTLELERQVGALLQSIDKTAETIERRLADDEDGAPKPGKEKPPAAAESSPEPEAGAETEAEPDDPEAAADAEADADIDAESAVAAVEDVEAGEADAEEAPSSEAADAEAGDDDIDAGVEELIAQATEAAVNESAATDVADGDGDGADLDDSNEDWVTQNDASDAEAAPGEAPAAPTSIADVDEQLSREAADAALADEDEIEGEFLSPDEVEDRLPDEKAADDGDAGGADGAAAGGSSVAAPAKPGAKAAKPEKAAPVAAAASTGAATPRRAGAIEKPLELARTALMIINKPFALLPRTLRDTIGWVAINTIFIAICVWIYLMLR